jgi:hypothetical protein
MSRVKKNFVALTVLFSLEFFSLGLFTNRIFSWTNQYVPVAAHTDAGALKLVSPAKTDGGFILKSYGEPTPQSEAFLTATQKPGISIRSLVVSRLFLRIIFAPKVSRYISKSVLNL